MTIVSFYLGPKLKCRAWQSTVLLLKMFMVRIFKYTIDVLCMRAKVFFPSCCAFGVSTQHELNAWMIRTHVELGEAKSA